MHLQWDQEVWDSWCVTREKGLVMCLAGKKKLAWDCRMKGGKCLLLKKQRECVKEPGCG